MNTMAINIAFFIAVTFVGYLLLANGVIHYRKYRRYFENRLSLALKQNFISISVGRLFLFNIVCLLMLATLGWRLLGLSGILLGLAIVSLIPFTIMNRIQQTRRKRFVQQLPDGLHALSASLRSGANMTRGLQQLSQWQPAPLSQEMGLVLAEHEFGLSLEDALKNLHQRIPSQEVELMNTAIILSRNVGGNVSDTLETLATTLTEKIGMEGKVDALTATGRLQGWVAMAIPIVVGFFIHTAQPEKMEFFYTDSRGVITSGVIAVMMILAFFSIKRIVKIDI